MAASPRGGIFSSSTRSVSAMAYTPSLKASMRPLPRSPGPPCPASMRHSSSVGAVYVPCTRERLAIGAPQHEGERGPVARRLPLAADLAPAGVLDDVTEPGGVDVLAVGGLLQRERAVVPGRPPGAPVRRRGRSRRPGSGRNGDAARAAGWCRPPCTSARHRPTSARGSRSGAAGQPVVDCARAPAPASSASTSSTGRSLTRRPRPAAAAAAASCALRELGAQRLELFARVFLGRVLRPAPSRR